MVLLMAKINPNKVSVLFMMSTKGLMTSITVSIFAPIPAVVSCGDIYADEFLIDSKLSLTPSTVEYKV